MPVVLAEAAPAKINLTLAVGSVRGDGFHPLESLVAQLEFHDTLRIAQRKDDQLVIECAASDVPTDESNLVHRAAELLAPDWRDLVGVTVALDKQIPTGAGLGGGSSNAAAALKLLNALWKRGLSDAELAGLGAQIGSDVPLFFHGPLSLVTGRGEVVQTVGHMLDAWVVLALPELRCATGAVYRAFDGLPAPPEHPPALTLLNAGGADALMPLLFNDLERAAFEVCPELRDVQKQLAGALGRHVRMTGSGSAFFHLYADANEAEQRLQLAKERVPSVRFELTRVRGT